MPNVLLDLLPYVNTGEPIPVELMLKALHEAEVGTGDPNRRQVANNLIAGAGDYLPGHLLAAFIRAVISDRDAFRLISLEHEITNQFDQLYLEQMIVAMIFRLSKHRVIAGNKGRKYVEKLIC
jgi:hypothetical protein